MRRVVVILALAAASPAWAETPAAAPAGLASDPTAITVDLGGRAIGISGPPGWVEVTARREIVRKTIEASVPPSSRHLATFAPSEDAARIDAGEEMTQWASFVAVKPFDRLEMAEGDFRQFQGMMRLQWGSIFDSTRRRMGAEFDASSERISEEIESDVEVSLDDLTSDGMFMDEPGAIGTIMFMKGDLAVANQSTDVRVAMAMMFVHVRSRAVVLSVYRNYGNEADLANLKSAAVAWKDALRAANSAGDIAP